MGIQTSPYRVHDFRFCPLDSCNLSPGGTVGIGIYLKSAQALFLGGPVAMNIAYLFVGSVAYAVAVKPTGSRKLIEGIRRRNDLGAPHPWGALCASRSYIIAFYCMSTLKPNSWTGICLWVGVLV